MSVSSPCEVCLSRDVEHSCDRCEKLVCNEHFDRAAGFCVECATELGGGDGSSQPEPGPDGVDTYRS